MWATASGGCPTSSGCTTWASPRAASETRCATAPDDTISRAQMASFLVRAFRLQRASSANFADTRGNVHEENIDALFAAGITVGCKQRPARFCPNRSTTRAHMATFLNRGLINAGRTIIGGGRPTDGTNTGNTGGTTGPGTITNSQGPRSGDTEMAAIRGRACAIRSDETVTCWGGDDGYREHLSAADLVDVAAVSISDRPSDALHSCAVHDNGDVSCWGAGSEGQLGQGNTDSYYLPQLVSGITDAVAVAAGGGLHMRGPPQRRRLLLGRQQSGPARRRHHLFGQQLASAGHPAL